MRLRALCCRLGNLVFAAGAVKNRPLQLQAYIPDLALCICGGQLFLLTILSLCAAIAGKSKAGKIRRACLLQTGICFAETRNLLLQIGPLIERSVNRLFNGLRQLGGRWNAIDSFYLN